MSDTTKVTITFTINTEDIDADDFAEMVVQDAVDRYGSKVVRRAEQHDEDNSVHFGDLFNADEED